MGERESDRIGLLQQLATLQPHPESVPINMLVTVEGTPLASMPALDPLEMVTGYRDGSDSDAGFAGATGGGRKQLSPEAVTLCFLAGANSIFVGEKLLTTPNPGPDEDEQLLQSLGSEATRISCQLNTTKHSLAGDSRKSCAGWKLAESAQIFVPKLRA